MVLAIDVSNTNIILGIYDNKKLVTSFKITTDINSTDDELGFWIKSLLKFWEIDIKLIKGVIISSVAPSIMNALFNAIEKYLNITPMIVNQDMEIGIKIKIDKPYELGADRLVSAVAASYIYGEDLIIADYETANTYDLINKEKEFLTGITAPGIRIRSKALYDNTALLSEVKIEMPNDILATNTTESIQAGIVFGVIGETEYIINRIKNEFKKNTKVIATGSYYKIVAEGTNIFDYIEPNLGLEGLKIIYDLNKNK